MGGKNSGTSRKRTTLPNRYRPNWLTKLDQRSALARGLHDHIVGIADDLGGIESLSVIQRDLTQRYVHACALATEIEGKAREGQPFDTGQLLAIYDRITRLAQAIGIQRRQRPVRDLRKIAAEPQVTQ